MNSLPATTAKIRVLHQSFQEQLIGGEISAGDYEWEFIWKFGEGELIIEPSLGRALIQDALMRFLIKTDYYLETGGDYTFIVRAKF